MAVNVKLVETAIAFLKAKFHQNSDVTEMVDFIKDSDPFYEMDEGDIKPIVEVAAKNLPARQAQPKKPPTGGQGRGNNAPAPKRYVRPDLVPSAPYRFVTLPDAVVMAPRDVSLDVPLADGFCATIDVEWAAETPLLIGVENNGVVEPMQTPGDGGTFVIPGATLRGVIRAAVEIVAYGRLGSANLHHRYGLRNFEHPAYADRSAVSRVTEVKAGWLEQRQTDDDNQEWTITPCHWAHVEIDRLLASSLARWPVQTRSGWNGLELAKKYAAVGMRTGDTFDFTRTFGFSTAAADNNRPMVTPDGPLRGTLVFAGKLPGKDGNKKFEYVFFPPGGEPVPVAPEIVATFKRLYSKTSKNRPQPDGSWQTLHTTLENRGRLPVFWVGDLAHQNKDFFFGLTRLFKIPHDRSVGDVLFQTQPNHRPKVETDAEGVVVGYHPDFVEALFGHVVERDELGLARDARVSPDLAGRKGRVAFSFAHLVSGQRTTLSDPVETVMMAPRASYAPFYLRAAAEKDYSADQPAQSAPRLAGRKRYPARYPARHDAPGQMKPALEMIAAISKGPPGNEDVKSWLRFLLPVGAPDLRFRSTIRLTNVTREEIGAVLFALTHGGVADTPCRHMIGRARPFGAGQMRVAATRLTVRANLPDNDTSADHQHFIDAFVGFMRKTGGGPTFPDVPAVREFLGMAAPGEVAKQAGHWDYMTLKDFADVRKAVQPLKPDGQNGMVKPPHKFPTDRDGRLLPVPSFATPISKK